MGTPRNPVTGAPASVQAGALAQLSRAQQAKRGPGPALTPISAVLTGLSIPAYAVGAAIRNPRSIVSGDSAIDIFRDRDKVLPGRALQERGAIPGGKLGGALSFGADVLLDPLTYLSLGGATAARAAGRGASAELVAKAARGKVTLADVAETSARVNVERAAVPRALSVGVQIPFTRARRLILAESEAIPAALSRIGSKVPSRAREAGRRAVSENFAPAAGTDKVVHRIGNDVRGAASTSKRDITRGASAFQKELDRAVKDAGLRQVEGYRAVTFAAEQPEKYLDDLAESLRPFAAEIRRQLDEFDAAETVAGIEKGSVPDYVPHRLLNTAERRRFEQRFGGKANLDSPFFVKERTFPTIEHGEAQGFAFELNPARLLEVRGHASVDAIAKKSIDDAVAGIRGVRRPPKAVPEVGPAAVKAADARARLESLSQPMQTAGLARTAKEARQAEREAQMRLAAARKTGDPAAVAVARADLLAVREAGSAEARRVAAEQISTAAPEVARLNRDIAATGGTLPTPSAGRYALPEVPVGIPIDQAAANGARFLDETPLAISETKPARVMDTRARRGRNAQGRPVEVGGGARTPEARERMERYFTPETTMASERDAIRSAAEREVERAIRKADRAVERAERRVAAAQKRGSTRAIRAARNELTRASYARFQARLALERARAGYVGSPREVAAQTKRVLKSDKALARVEREAEKVRAANARLESRPGTPLSVEEWKALGDEWQEMPSKYLRDVKVDAETRRALDRVYEQITPKMTSEAGIAALSRFANTVTARWKALALMNPGFHLRNQFDDSMRAFWAGGRNPKSYTDAYRILAGKGPKIRVTIDGETLDPEGIVRLVKALGITDQGFSGKEVAAGLSDTAGSIKRAGQKVRQPGTGAGSQLSRKVGDLRENAIRLGTFLERVKAGDNAYEAARIVKEFHMDYGDVGRFVERARRFWLPFVTYTAKALPLIGRQAVRRPGTLANLNKAMIALNEAGGAPDLSLLPTGQRSSFAIPAPGFLRDALGGNPGDPILYNPERTFSLGVLNQLDPTQIQAQGLGLANPFAKSAVEIPTGYRFYYAGQAAKRQRAPWLIQQAARLPGVGSAIDFGPKRYRYRDQVVPGYGSTADAIMRLFPPFSQSSSLIPSDGAPSVGPSAGSYLTGVRLSPYDRARDAYYAKQAKDRR